MKALLEKIQQKVSEITELKYIDENWGQLDYYSPNMPVQYIDRCATGTVFQHRKRPYQNTPTTTNSSGTNQNYHS